jgi:hypothetical protein
MFLIGRKGKVIGCEIESFGAWERCRSENGDTFSHVVEERRDVPTIRQQVHEPVESFALESFAVESFAVESFAVESFAVESFAVESFAVESFAVESFAVESLAVESFAVESFAEWRKNRPGDLWKMPEHAR